MKIVLLCLLFTSCANNSRIIKSERHDTYLVGLKCPVNYYYRLDDRLCHYSGPREVIGSVKSISSAKLPKLAKNKLAARVVNANARKPVKQAKIDCAVVMNQCFKGDL